MENTQKQNPIDRKLLERIVHLTAAVAFTAVVLKYTMPVISDIIYTQTNA